MRASGKVLVVTGGGNGIGQQVVLELLRRGARVAAVDLSQEGLDETRRLAGDAARLWTATLDITDRQAVLALPPRVADALGPVDGVLNVAGIIQPFVRLADLGFDAVDRVLAVNLDGTINVVKAILPGLLQRPEGHVLLVSSMGGFLPVPGQTVYGASKAAVKLLAEGLYAELQGSRVGVTVVMPGAVATNITGNSGVDVPGGAAAAEESSFPTTSPQDAARTIVQGLEDARLHVFVGRDARLMDVARRIAPKRATDFITRKMGDLLNS